MRECPRCSAAYDEGLRFCPADGAELVGPGDRTLTLGRDAPVLGSYRLLQLLGQGGMGRVFLAEHVKLGRKVALKMLRQELAADAEAVRRFFAEARAVNQVAHENIVSVTDFFEADGSGQAPYLIMEFLEGESLRALLDREPVPALSRSVGIALQLADALAAVHAAGIVHRDLKPDNVFLVERGGKADVVKILDFGVAKLRSSGDGRSMLHTAHGTVLGTPEYMSPEQAEATLKVDHRADVYALGVILYEMVSGKKPIVGSTISETLIKQLTWTPPLPSEAALDSSIPVELEALIMRCLEKQPDRRPRDMREVHAGLRGVLQQLAGSTAPMRAIPSAGPEASDPTVVSGDGGGQPSSSAPPTMNLRVAPATPATPAKNTAAIAAVALAALSLAIAAGGLWYLLSPKGDGGVSLAGAREEPAPAAGADEAAARRSATEGDAEPEGAPSTLEEDAARVDAFPGAPGPGERTPSVHEGPRPASPAPAAPHAPRPAGLGPSPAPSPAPARGGAPAPAPRPAPR
ncbi:MAG TPA: serine/threonine-protein kinase [Vulgatibacter sp.]|nr:serine/threonine-protein kinase [Vulgatibacter sp.]